jgi:hypothetical protein
MSHANASWRTDGQLERTETTGCLDMFVSLAAPPGASCAQLDLAWSAFTALVARHGGRLFPGGGRYGAVRFRASLARAAFLADPAWQALSRAGHIDHEDWRWQDAA